MTYEWQYDRMRAKARKYPPKKFRKGQRVKPMPTCKDETVFIVLGPPIYQGQWWTPINDPREEDPTFFKTAMLVPLGPEKEKEK